MKRMRPSPSGLPRFLLPRPRDVVALAAGIALILAAMQGTAGAAPDHALVQVNGQDEVYWVQNGVRYHVLNPGVMQAQESSGIPGWGWSKITFVSAGTLNGYKSGPGLLSSASNGMLVRATGQGEVHLIEGGRRRHVQNEQAMQDHGYEFADVVVVAPSLLSAIPAGTPIAPNVVPPTSSPTPSASPGSAGADPEILLVEWRDVTCSHPVTRATIGDWVCVYLVTSGYPPGTIEVAVQEPWILWYRDTVVILHVTIDPETQIASGIWQVTADEPDNRLYLEVGGEEWDAALQVSPRLAAGAGAPNSSSRQRFEAAYDPTFGEPYNEVHEWGGVYVQDFDKNGNHSILIDVPTEGAAFWVYGAILQHYIGQGGPGGWLGEPLSHEMDDPRGAWERISLFRYGVIAWDGATAQHLSYEEYERTSALHLFRLPVADGRPGCGFDSVCAYETPHHAGVDYFGDIAVAAAPGIVSGIQPNDVHCGNPRVVKRANDPMLRRAGCADHGMGNTVIVQHRLETGEVVYSLYAHLDHIDVEIGQCVSSGQRVGAIGGTGQGDRDYWSKHLHFEIKTESTITAPGAPAGNNYGYTPLASPLTLGYHSPNDFIDRVRAHGCDGGSAPSQSGTNHPRVPTTYRGSVTDHGISLLAAQGNPTPDQLVEDLTQHGCRPRSLWVLRGLLFVGYSPNAPSFVNAAFPERLEDGQPLVVLCR